MLSLLKQCSSLGQVLTRAPVSAALSVAQSRGFWRLVDNRYTDPDNKGSKYPQPSIEQDDIFDSRQEMYKDGFGIKLYDLKDGERKSLKAVVARFKRLDWGPWIRPRSGRAKKLWKKSMLQLNNITITREKYLYIYVSYFLNRLSRMWFAMYIYPFPHGYFPTVMSENH